MPKPLIQVIAFITKAVWFVLSMHMQHISATHNRPSVYRSLYKATSLLLQHWLLYKDTLIAHIFPSGEYVVPEISK